MIHILILIALGFATYLFHNYQAFNEAYLRPWVVEQVNFNREANPQALCDLLAPDAVVIVKDRYTRYSYNFSGGKTEACEYFLDSAKTFSKNLTQRKMVTFGTISRRMRLTKKIYSRLCGCDFFYGSETNWEQRSRH